MKTTLMRRMAAGVALSAVLAIGHPASADEQAAPAWRSGVTLEDVALTRGQSADPPRLAGPSAPEPAGRAADSAAIGPRASGGERAAAPAGSTQEGIILPRDLRADPVPFDSRNLHASASLLTRGDGGAQDARTRAREARRRRIGLGAVIGAGVGGTLGAYLGAHMCYNDGGRNCTLTFDFGALGVLAGVGVGAALGALGDKMGWLPRPGRLPRRPPRQ